MMQSIETNKTHQDAECLDVLGLPIQPLLYFKGAPTGILINILDIFSQRTGICYKFRLTKSYFYGVDTGNGSFNGMIGELQRKETDIVATALSITFQRRHVIDFTEPILTDRHSVFFKYPKTEPDISGFLKPFSAKSWGVTILTTLVIWMVMAFFYQKLRSYFNKSETIRENSLASSFLYPIGILIGQGVCLTNVENLSKELNNFRVLLMTWLLGCLILICVYKSKLNAMMTAPSFKIPFRNLEEMVEQKDLPFSAGPQTYVNYLLKTSPEGTLFHKIYSKLSDHAEKHKSSLAPVQDGIFAIFGLVFPAETILHQQFSALGYCKLSMMRETFLEVNIAMGIRKNASWKKDLDEIIIHLKEAGIISHWLHQSHYKYYECIKAPSLGDELRPLELHDFFGVFSMLAGGLFLSGVLFGLELLIK